MKYSELEKNLYTFYYRVSKITDGDSLRGTIDRAFYDSSERDIRLARVNAWEKRGKDKEKGILAWNFVQDLIKPGDKVIIKSLGEDSFGRVVSEVYLNINEETVNLSDLLVQENHAIYIDYTGLKKY